MTNTLCNYPACSGKCGGEEGQTGCKCTTSFYSSPSPCSCTDPHFLGTFCNIEDKCLNTSFCVNGTCNEPSIGDYEFLCTDTDQCLNANVTLCPPGQFCIDHPFYYTCDLCQLGFTYSASICVDIDECQTLNGGCDFHVQCTNFPGGFSCGSCPVGFVGNGSISGGCIAQCGNNACEDTLGENCVTCPFDCNSTACNVCGDSVCQRDAGESCSTCPEDCGLCVTTPCIPADCSKHGQCNGGICVCNSGWGGPACDKDNSNINLNFTSGGGLQVNTDNPDISFLLSISSIAELDAQGQVVTAINITNQNYTFSLVNDTQFTNSSSNFVACSNCDLPFYVRTQSDGNANKIYKYNITLENEAYLEFMIWQFLDPNTTVSFANLSSQFYANSFKLAFQLRNWPFRNLRNSLGILIDAVQNDLKQCAAVKSNEDELHSLKWYTINVKGVTLYGQFLNRSIVDGLFRTVTFRLNANNSVTAIVPHFWENLVLDPSFSVLIGTEDSSCHKKSNTTLIIAIIVPVVVVFLVAFLVFLMYPKIKAWNKVRKEKRKLGFSKKHEEVPNEDKDVEIEQLKALQVNSAAGNFVVQL